MPTIRCSISPITLSPSFKKADLGIDESVGEKLAFYFANNKDELTNLLKGVVQVNSTPTNHLLRKSG